MVGIIGAMKCEVEVITSILENIKTHEWLGRKFYVGSINNTEIVIVESGVGKVNAAITTAYMCENYKVDYVINLGVAGGISPVKTFDLVISKGLCYHDVDVSPLGYEVGVIPGSIKMYPSDNTLVDKCKKIAKESNISYMVGNIASGDIFATNPSCISGLNEEIYAVEMEGAAIAHVCYQFKVPFICLRVISDVLGTNGQAVSFSLVEKEAADLASKFVLGIIEK